MKLISFGEIIWDVYPDRAILGGAPFNFAAHAALQGADAYLLSAVGCDEYATRSLSEISVFGVNTDYVGSTDKASTGKCLVTLDKNGMPKYDVADPASYDYISFDENIPADFDVVAFGTLALRRENNRASLLSLLDHVKPREVFTDLNIRPPFYSKESIEICLSRGTIVKLSDEDMAYVSRIILGEETDCEGAARMLSEKYPNIKLMLITKGEKGSTVYCRDGGYFIECPAKKAEVVSTVGAGDSFGATFLVSYMNTRDIPLSMSLASEVSAFVVSRKEAVPTDMKEFLS